MAAGLPADDVVVADLPGVRAVGLTSSVPLRSRDYFAPNWRWRIVDAGYFDVVSIPILAGRTFDVGDRGGAQPVAIVNHTLAQQAFGTDDVVGRMLDDRLIVGLVADVRHRRLDEPTEPEIYLPVAQHNEDRLSLVVLADRAPEARYLSVR